MLILTAWFERVCPTAKWATHDKNVKCGNMSLNQVVPKDKNMKKCGAMIWLCAILLCILCTHTELGDCFSQLSCTPFSTVFIHYDHAQKKCTSKIRGGKGKKAWGWVGKRKLQHRFNCCSCVFQNKNVSQTVLSSVDRYVCMQVDESSFHSFY